MAMAVSARRHRVRRLERQAPLEGLRGGIQVLELPAGQAEIEQRFHPVAALLDAQLEAVHGGGEIAPLELEESQAVGGVLPIRFQADQFREQPFGFFRAALALVEQRQVPQQAGRIGSSGQSCFASVAGAVADRPVPRAGRPDGRSLRELPDGAWRLRGRRSRPDPCGRFSDRRGRG